MNQRVGSCSICGGDVMGERGPWWSITPPPPDKCSNCGAVAATDVIQMTKPKPGWDYIWKCNNCKQHPEAHEKI